MTQSLAKVAVHLVFSTKNRESVLKLPVREELYAYMVGILHSLKCAVLAVGGTEDRVHMLVLMSRTISLSEMVMEVKKGSSRWLKNQGEKFKVFTWQGGYGAFSVSESQIQTVIAYIQNQEEHHRKISFQDEFRSLLIKHQMQFDEKYVWT